MEKHDDIEEASNINSILVILLQFHYYHFGLQDKVEFFQQYLQHLYQDHNQIVVLLFRDVLFYKSSVKLSKSIDKNCL